MNLTSSRLAAKTGTNQLDALHACNAIGYRADEAIRSQWRKLIALLTAEGKRRQSQLTTSAEFHHKAITIIHAMHLDAHKILHTDLTKLATWGHAAAVDALVGVLPLSYLRAAASGRQLESRQFAEAGIIQFGRHTQDLAEPLREPVADKLTADEQRELFRRLLFPSPGESRIAAILRHPIGGISWEQDLSVATRLADPHTLVGLISRGFSQGQTPREVAKSLLPAVGEVQSTARRVARTYGMQIVHRVTADAHAGVDDLIVGYQVHAQLDQNTRSWHAHRSGEIYYKQPGPNQKGEYQQPHPPLEAADPSERPANTPRMAWCCRCWLSPVLKPVEALRNHPEFQNADEKPIPNPVVYDDWFRRADEQKRRLAVGTRRYDAVADQVGRDPEWADFLHPETGELLKLQTLRDEAPHERNSRVAAVRQIIHARHHQARQVLAMGFV